MSKLPISQNTFPIDSQGTTQVGEVPTGLAALQTDGFKSIDLTENSKRLKDIK